MAQRNCSIPFLNVTLWVNSVKSFYPSSLRHFCRALNKSLNTFASAGFRDKHPLVLAILRRTVAMMVDAARVRGR